MKGIAAAFIEVSAASALAAVQREAVQAVLVAPRGRDQVVTAELVQHGAQERRPQIVRAQFVPHDDTDKVPERSFVDDVHRKKKLQKVMGGPQTEDENDERDPALPDGATPFEKDDVNYRYGADKNQQCWECVHFREPGSCELVAGLIRRVDTCDKFKAEEGVTRATLVGLGESDLEEAMSRSHYNLISRALYDAKEHTEDHGHLVDNVASALSSTSRVDINGNRVFDKDRFKKAAMTNPIPYSALKNVKLGRGAFKDIADALSRSATSSKDHRKVVGTVADALAGTNASFDREKFHHASGDREYKRDEQGRFAASEFVASEAKVFKRTTRGKFSTVEHGRDARRAGVQVAKTVVYATEVSPPGYENVVQGLKKSGNVDNPWAVAWSMSNKGIEPKTTEDTHGHYPGEFAGERDPARQAMRRAEDRLHQSTLYWQDRGHDDAPQEKKPKDDKRDPRSDPRTVQQKRYAMRKSFEDFEGGPGSGRRPEGRGKFAPDSHDDEDSATAAFTRRETPEERYQRIKNKPVDKDTKSALKRLWGGAVKAGRREGVMANMQDRSTIPGIGA